MPATNVKSDWSGGDLCFYDKSGNQIFNIDGTNRNLEIPSGSTLVIGGTLSGALTQVNSVAASLIDAAITITAANKDYFITKAGVCALTIVDPTATTHDGVVLRFVATTANAHTLSNAAGSGFFSSGGASKDVATFGGAIGDRFVIEAYQGKWYVVDSLNITLG